MQESKKDSLIMLIEDLKQLPTFYLEGKFEHKDLQGHSGVINAGYVQRMTADSGVIHSEIPEKEFSTKVNSSSQLKFFKPVCPNINQIMYESNYL